MTKKDFIALPDAIRSHNNYNYPSEWKQSFTTDQLNLLACFCHKQNPRFRVSQWLDYIAGKCGPSGGKVK